MPDFVDDKKELATNRLLEVLRGDSVEDATAIKEPALSGLSEAERSKQGKPAPAGETVKPDSSLARTRPSLAESFRSKIVSLVKSRKRLIGIDIGSDSIKYIFFIKGKNEFILKDMGIRKIEEHYTGDPQKKLENIRRALNELIPDLLKKNSAVATTVFGPNVSIKKVNLPKLSAKELGEAIIWNAKKELPFSGDNAAFEYKILGSYEEQGVEKIDVLVAIVDNALITEHIQFLRSVSITPRKILAVPLSIYSVFLRYFDAPENANGVVIDIGAKITQIIFIQNGNLQFAREISTGGDDITEGIMGTISGSLGAVKIDRDEAERLKFVYGIPPENAVQQLESGITLNQIASVMRPTLERLLVQIQRSFDYYHTKFPFEEPKKVYVSGGTALLKNIASFFAHGLNKEVEIFNPLKGFIIDPQLEEDKNVSAVAPCLAVAVGSVLSDDKGINLVPKEIKETFQFAFQQRIFAVAAVIIVAIIMMLSVMVNSELNSVKSKEVGLQSEKGPKDVMKTTYNTYLNKVTALKTQYSVSQINFEKFAGTIQIRDYIALLSTLKRDYISIESLEIDAHKENKLVIRGFVNVSVSYVDKSGVAFYLSSYLRSLENSGMFQKVLPYKQNEEKKSGSDEEQNESIYRFIVECKLFPTVSYK
jgi:type IV pilus assembly protein PilM